MRRGNDRSEMENLWNLERYPKKLCVEEWREVNTDLLNSVSKEKVFLTARKTLEDSLDLGPYPLTESDVNDENRWMTFIQFENGSHFNILVLKTLVRVKAVDFISKGEQLRFKYEVEQPPITVNLKCLVRQLKSLIFQPCSIVNCTCCIHKVKDNYFLLRKEEINRVSNPPLTTLKKWKRKLEINFHRAENHKNTIFNRISLNPFTINLRHKLWDKIEENNNSNSKLIIPDQNEFQQFVLPLKRRRRHSGNLLNSKNQTVCMDCGDKHNLRARLKPSASSEENYSNNLRNSCVSIQYGNRKCKLCDVIYGNPQDLSNRRRMMYRREVCENVGKWLLKDKLKCEECGLVVKNMRGLRIHKSRRHRSKFSGIYVRKSGLTAFKDVKSVEGGLVIKVKEEVVDVTCIKGVIFDRKLSKTKVVIEKLRLFPCNTCDKEFLRRQNLKNHEKYCLKVTEDGVDNESDSQDTLENQILTTPPLLGGGLTDNLPASAQTEEILGDHQSKSESVTGEIVETIENITEETLSSVANSSLSCTEQQKSTSSTPNLLVEENLIPVVFSNEENDRQCKDNITAAQPCLNQHRQWKVTVNNCLKLRLSLLEKEFSMPDQIQENTMSTPMILDDTATISQDGVEVSTPWALQGIPISKLQQIIENKNTSPVQNPENTISSVGRHQDNSVKSFGSDQESTNVVNCESLDQIFSSPFEINETVISTIFEIIDNSNFSSVDVTESIKSSTDRNNEHEIPSSSTSSVHQMPFCIGVDDNLRSPLNPSESTLDLPNVENNALPDVNICVLPVRNEDTLSAISDENTLSATSDDEDTLTAISGDEDTIPATSDDEDTLSTISDDEDTLSAISDDQGSIITPSGTYYVCKICGRRFNFEFLWKFHMDMHSNASLNINNVHFRPCCQIEGQLRLHLKGRLTDAKLSKYRSK